MKLETKETKSERPHDTVVNGVDSTAERAGFQSQLAYVLLGDEGELLHVTVPHVSSSMKWEPTAILASKCPSKDE